MDHGLMTPIRFVRASLAVVACVAPVAWVACGSDDTTTSPDVDASVDATNDVTARDTGSDSGKDASGDNGSDADGGSDAGADADAGDGASADGDDGPDSGDNATYNDMMTLTNWTSYDLVGSAGLTQNGLYGGAFDGRYVYLACANGGPTTRYDTQGNFTTAASWSTFNTTPDVEGALFDGRYLYLVPSLAPTALRYDTQAAFNVAGSWSSFTTTGIATSAHSFDGAVFDGRYLYYMPGFGTGTMARFDTQGTFTSAASWTSFGLTTLNGALTQLHGGMFDGRYVYSANYTGGLVTRYDTTATFADANSWKVFSTAGVNAAITGLYAAGFDGRYVYFAPDSYTTASVLARYDITMPFDQAGSWSTFDITTVSPLQTHHYVTAFDGRYMYFAPGQGRRITRYDTRAPFANAASWSSLDLSQLTTSSTDIGSAVFDGRYLYLAPIESGTHVMILRFDAKSPSKMPTLPQFRGSFY